MYLQPCNSVSSLFFCCATAVQLVMRGEAMQYIHTRYMSSSSLSDEAVVHTVIYGSPLFRRHQISGYEMKTWTDTFHLNAFQSLNQEGHLLKNQH